MEFDGILISELGVKQYLKGMKSQSFTSLPILQRQKEIARRWEECNFGCHTPSYRTNRKNISKSEFLSSMNKISPLLGGFTSGLEAQTIHQADLLLSSAKRTGEGLGLSGPEAFHQVGDENFAAAEMISVSLRQLLDFNFDSLDHPICQLVFTIIMEYIKLIPEWVILETLESGALIIPDGDANHFAIQASHHNLVEKEMIKHIDMAANMLKNSGRNLVLKQIGSTTGKSLAKSIALLIAAKITKKIMRSPNINFGAKRRIAALKRSANKTKGGLTTALSILLKTNGYLGIAARDSRRLKSECPKLWLLLRYRLKGLDLLTFLIRDNVQEYIDRISILERDPKTFIKLMKALIDSGKTTEIFLPA